MQTYSRAATSLVAAFALAAAVQAPALAQTYTHTDARHDVVEAPQDVRAHKYRKADVTHLRITHGLKAVRFTIRLRSASMKNLKFRVVGFKVKTADHTFTGAWIAAPDSAQYDLINETGQSVTCAESSGRVGRTIWLRLDRACFGTPRWVRASVHVGTNNGTMAWGDNALSDHWRHSNDDVFSPRIHSS